MWGHFLPREGKRVGSLRKGDQLVEVISDKWHTDGVCFLIVISLLYTPVTSYVLVLPQFGCCKEGKKTVYQVPRHYIGVSQVALVVKNLPANVGDIRDRVRSLGQEDPLEEGMATHSSILAWRIPWTEKPGGLWSTRSQSQTRLK